jgi:hypothetical protein
MKNMQTQRKNTQRGTDGYRITNRQKTVTDEGHADSRERETIQRDG